VSPLRWTTKSTRKLAAELTARGHKVSADTIGDLLRGQGFSLQGNAKTVEGAAHRDRDAQFRYISERAREHQDAGEPVASVDTKNKELVADFANGGRECRPKGSPVPVRTHDFIGKDLGKAIPYGSTTSRPMPGGCRWAPITTLRRSLSSRSAAGGGRWAGPPAPARGGC
jgi:Rhodopirellula transposase DDE domain